MSDKKLWLLAERVQKNTEGGSTKIIEEALLISAKKLRGVRRDEYIKGATAFSLKGHKVDGQLKEYFVRATIDEFVRAFEHADPTVIYEGIDGKICRRPRSEP